MGTNDIGNVTMIVRLVTKFFVVVVVIFVVHSLNLTDLMGNESLSKCAVSVCGSYQNGFTTSSSVALKVWGRRRKWTKKKMKKIFFRLFCGGSCVDRKSRIHSFCGTINIGLWTAFWYMPSNSNIHFSFFPFFYLITHSFSLHILSLWLVFVSKRSETPQHITLAASFRFFLFMCTDLFSLFLSFRKWSLTVFHWDRISKAILLLFFLLVLSFISLLCLFFFNFEWTFCLAK